MLFYIIIFTLIGSVLSLAGGSFLLFNKKLTLKLSHLFISFAAGTLLGTAFFDLMPEALEEAGEGMFVWIVFGVLFFFVVERFIHWFHHHGNEGWCDKDHTDPTVPLIIIGDSIHNFIDGVVIAASFLVNIPLGIITALAVAAHEIPQEIGDFAVLLHEKVSRRKVIMFNLFSALASLVGALLMFYLRETLVTYLPVFISITAGFFIYIASSDLIPEIHHEKRKGFAFYETVLLFLGVFIVWYLVTLLE